MANARTVAIGLSFADREGNRAKATCYCAFALPEDDVWSLAFFVADKMQAISNGVLSKIELVWRYTIDDPGTPAEESDVARKILMLMTNEDGEVNGIVIPSPGDIWETTGSYAGIRLDLAGAGALGWADMLLVMDLRTEDNRAVGTVLTAGGLML